jgi:hypothetical protein
MAAAGTAVAARLCAIRGGHDDATTAWLNCWRRSRRLEVSNVAIGRWWSDDGRRKPIGGPSKAASESVNARPCCTTGHNSPCGAI